jgi:hypothetical protein
LQNGNHFEFCKTTAILNFAKCRPHPPTQPREKDTLKKQIRHRHRKFISLPPKTKSCPLRFFLLVAHIKKNFYAEFFLLINSGISPLSSKSADVAFNKLFQIILAPNYYPPDFPLLRFGVEVQNGQKITENVEVI